jgi:hypothetical protein
VLSLEMSCGSMTYRQGTSSDHPRVIFCHRHQLCLPTIVLTHFSSRSQSLSLFAACALLPAPLKIGMVLCLYTGTPLHHLMAAHACRSHSRSLVEG